MPPRKSKQADNWWLRQMEKAGTAVPVVSEPRSEAPAIDVYRERAADLMGSPDVVYEPTATIKPGDPRTSRIEYYRAARVMRVFWGDGGTAYDYFEVTPSEMSAMLRVKSPGRKINRTFNSKPYGRVEG